MTAWEDFLSNIYFKIKEPGAFSGPKKLQVILKQNGYNVALSKIRKWTQQHDAYSLFKPVRYRFKRNRIVTTGLDYMWDVDLADVSNISEYNDGNKYFLVLIDVFSRYLWLQPVKSKNARDIKGCFQEVFRETNRRPDRLRTDKGKEFVNKQVKDYLKSLDIKAFTTKNETKANYAERVIRTIKTLLYRYFHQNQTYRYVDIIQDLVENYNNRPHSSLGKLTPAQVNKQNEAKVWKQMYIDTAVTGKKQRFKFQIGDKVRISHLKYTFQRDFHQKWTEEFFKIKQRIRRGSKNVYRIKDMMDEEIDGYFYEIELQKIIKDDEPVLRIEKVIRRRNRGQELLVKYMGWPSKFNSWIQADSVQMF